MTSNTRAVYLRMFEHSFSVCFHVLCVPLRFPDLLGGYETFDMCAKIQLPVDPASAPLVFSLWILMSCGTASLRPRLSAAAHALRQRSKDPFESLQEGGLEFIVEDTTGRRDDVFTERDRTVCLGALELENGAM